jgi:hypothetical protein
MLQRPHIRRLIARSFLALFALILLNGIVFRHAHKLSSGKVIAHAHPYKPVGNTPYQPNAHTDNELYLLDLVANGGYVFAPEVPILTLALITFIVAQSSFFSYRQRFLSRTQQVLSLRGPPQVGR